MGDLGVWLGILEERWVNSGGWFVDFGGCLGILEEVFMIIGERVGDFIRWVVDFEVWVVGFGVWVGDFGELVGDFLGRVCVLGGRVSAIPEGLVGDTRTENGLRGKLRI